MWTGLQEKIPYAKTPSLSLTRGQPNNNLLVMDQKNLDRVFGALSDATRRGILAQLAAGETNVAALAEPYAMSQPAISKHLKVLEKAGLISREKRGRENIVTANAEPAEAAVAWITHYAQFWKDHFDQVEKYLQENQKANS